MSKICNSPLSPFEMVGRNLAETPTINKQGVVKDKVIYPKLAKDKEPGREHLFTNKLSVVRLCRGNHDRCYPWEEHLDIWKLGQEKREQAKKATKKNSIVLKGFLACNVTLIRQLGYDIVPDGSESNPYHAHIIIPDYNVPFFEDAEMISDVLPEEVKSKLDRLRGFMSKYIINPWEDDRTPCTSCEIKE